MTAIQVMSIQMELERKRENKGMETGVIGGIGFSRAGKALPNIYIFPWDVKAFGAESLQIEAKPLPVADLISPQL
ncbi:MAG: hypothetical protein EOO09_08600 [Chitinophagaceae bacterium]|nr:MAG: hypothetical protein EOO09_08600 [Chitinophagaceae bacterium]